MTRRPPTTALIWPPPAHWVGRAHAGTLLDAPLLPGPRSRPWAAVVWPDGRAPGGWARGPLPPGRWGRGWVAAALTPGDVIEFGADEQRGRRRPPLARRWYGVVLATDRDRVVAWGPFPEPGAAWDVAQQALSAWRTAAHITVPGVTDSQATAERDGPPPAPRSANSPRPDVAAGRHYRASADGTVEVGDGQGVAYRLTPARRYTPDGFGWGHEGDSARELAYALLADATGSPETAGRLAARYTRAVTARLPAGEGWTLPVGAVRGWARDAQPARPAAGAEIGL